MRRTRRLLFAAVLTIGSASVDAAQTWGEEYAKRIRSTELVTPLGDNLFGDSIKLFDGTVTFSAGDISIPGNNALPVELRRTLDLQDKSYPRALADWQLDIPYIGGIFAANYANQLSCDGGRPLDVTVGPETYIARDYWSGNQLHVDGSASEMLVDHGDPEVQIPTSPIVPSKWRTKDGWFFTCMGLLANDNPNDAYDNAQGFYAYAPDGRRFTFNWRVVRDHPSIAKQNDPYHLNPLARWDVRLYATKVEDRFGNYVNFVWDTANSHPNDLDKITSSDGREIDLTYGPRYSGVAGQGDFGRLDSAYAHGRTWSFGYGTSPEGPALSSVTNPDGSAWAFNRASFTGQIFYEVQSAPATYQYAPQGSVACSHTPVFKYSGGGAYPAGGGVYSITHPSGAQASYTLVPKKHGRTKVPYSCKNQESSDPRQRYNQPSLLHDVLSLTQKQISGPAIGVGLYQYTYANIEADHAPYGTYVPTAANSKTVTVQAPDGTQTIHTFGKEFQINEGRLQQTQIKKDNQVLQTVTTTYLADGEVPNLPMPDKMGSVLALGVDEYSAAAMRPVVSKVTVRDSISYEWTVGPWCNPGYATRCLDAYGRPFYVVRSSPYGNRTDYFSYYDDKSLWVIGQPLGRGNSDTGLFESTTEYHPSTALPWKHYRFGQLQETLTYTLTPGTQAGTLNTVTDGNYNVITLSNWKRGVPQTITYPTQLRQSGVFDTDTAVVNDRGEIDSVTDELGNKTCYGYDPMGRLGLVTYPSESSLGVCDASTWAPTVLSFVKVPAQELQYNLPLGHWRHTVTTGARKKETFYDELWRPILTRESATDGSAGVRAVRRKFDWNNRETFASVPRDTFTNYTDAAFDVGTDTIYDALGRVTGTAQDAEAPLGTITTSTSYANGQTVFTDGRFNSTTTAYQAFDEPTLEAPIIVTGPDGVTTYTTRDVFGKPLTMSRSGTYTPPGGATENLSVTRRFVYDSAQRLCKTIEPDAGITVMDYDPAGNVAWQARGQNTLVDTAACQRESAVNRSVHTYDALNRLRWIDHPAGTSDVGYTYEADGAMKTATVGTLDAGTPPGWASTLNQWTYDYTHRRQLTSESLSVGTKTFSLGWLYNSRGDTYRLTYPSGQQVYFNNNAYGEPSQVGSYATSAIYHPSGGVAGFTYGNGTTRTITPNTRNLPAQIVDSRYGVKWLDHVLTYDGNANLKSIVDGVADPEGQASESRTLTYDVRNRLTSVTAAATGNETYEYDPLDNVRRVVRGGVDRRFGINLATHRLGQITTAGSASTVDHAWNDRGELASRTTTTVSVPVITPPTIHRNGFEDNINTTTETYGFDQARRLMSYSYASYQYDAHNHRVTTALPAWGTRYQVYSRAGELLYVEDEGAKQRTEFFHLNGTLVAERTRPLDSETATVNYLHSDHRGTPTVKTSSGGARVYRSRLMPYGTPYDGILRDGPGFTKHATDEVGGLSYMQQRYYDFSMQRFLSPDPVGVGVENFNRYAYANNNPYTFVDPDGRESAMFQDDQYLTPPLDAASARQGLSHAADFTPVIGDIKGFVDAYNDPTAINVIAAVVGLVPGYGDVAGKTLKAGGNIAENAAKGARAEAAVAAKLGDQVAGQRVTLEATTGQRSVADIVTTEAGVVEVKSGNARLSSGQQAVKADIDAGRPVIPRGQNAADAGLQPGQPTVMTCYSVERCP